NIEGNPFPDFMEIVARAHPHQCTLVPDSPEQSTSDHGWDIRKDAGRLKSVIAQLHGRGCRISGFMDSDLDQIRLVPQTGADRVELYTEPYASAFQRGENVDAV